MVFLKTFFPATKHHSHYFQSIIFTRKCIGNEYVFQQISTLFKTPKTKQLNPFFSFFIKGKLKKKNPPKLLLQDTNRNLLGTQGQTKSTKETGEMKTEGKAQIRLSSDKRDPLPWLQQREP